MTAIGFVPPQDIRKLHAELVSTTSLTQHKGGFFGVVLGLAIAVAIPFAAPAIAAAIGFSGTIAAAVVGGVLGAAGALITGGNPLLGAAGGAFGGFAGAGGLSEISGAAAAGAEGAAGGIGAAGQAPALGAQGLVSGAEGTAFGPGFFDSATAGFDSFAAGVNPTSVDLGGALSGLDTSFAAPIGGDFAGFGADSAGSGFNLSSAPGVSTSGVVPEYNLSPQFRSAESFPGQFDSGTAYNTNPGDIPAEAPKPGFFDRILKSDTAGKAITKLGTQALSNALVPKPSLTDGEKALQAQRDAALKQQQDLLEGKRDIANAFLDQSASVSPTREGMNALTEEQKRLLRAQEAGLRSIPIGRDAQRQGTIRRNALDRSRLGGFSRGYANAQTRQDQLIANAASTLPTGDKAVSSTQAALTADAAYNARLDAERKAAAGVFEPIFRSVFTGDSEEERKRKAALVG